MFYGRNFNMENYTSISENIYSNATLAKPIVKYIIESSKRILFKDSTTKVTWRQYSFVIALFYSLSYYCFSEGLFESVKNELATTLDRQEKDNNFIIQHCEEYYRQIIEENSYLNTINSYDNEYLLLCLSRLSDYASKYLYDTLKIKGTNLLDYLKNFHFKFKYIPHKKAEKIKEETQKQKVYYGIERPIVVNIIESINNILDLDYPNNEDDLKGMGLLSAHYNILFIVFLSPSKDEILTVANKVLENYCNDSFSSLFSFKEYNDNYTNDIGKKLLPTIKQLANEPTDTNCMQILELLSNYTEGQLKKIYGNFEEGKVFYYTLSFFNKLFECLLAEEDKISENNEKSLYRKEQLNNITEAIIEISHKMFKQCKSYKKITSNSIAFSYAYFMYITALAEPLSHDDIIIIDGILIDYIESKRTIGSVKVLELMGDYSETLGKRFNKDFSNITSLSDIESALLDLSAYACVFFSENDINLSTYIIQEYTIEFISKLEHLLD